MSDPHECCLLQQHCWAGACVGVHDPAPAATSLCKTHLDDPWIQLACKSGGAAVWTEQADMATTPQGAPSQPLATAAKQAWQDAICDNAPFTQVKAPSSAMHSLSPLLSQVSVNKTHPAQPTLVFTLSVRFKTIVF